MEAEHEDAVAAVVVGQAKGHITLRDVTVTESEIATSEGVENAKVGGLVGKLEGSAEDSTLTVEESSFDGSGASEFVGDKGEVTDVTVTDSSFTDTETDTTSKWDEEGKHYAEDEDGNRSYFVSSVEDINDLVSDAQSGEKVDVTLESDLGLTESGLTVGSTSDSRDLSIDINGHDLTVKAQSSNPGIKVNKGSNLTITDSQYDPHGENKSLSLTSGSKGGVEATGTGSTLNLKNIEINCKKSTTNSQPVILANNGATVNLGEGAIINQDNTNSSVPYNNAYSVQADGSKSTINIDGATLNCNGYGSSVMTRNGATINFTSGTINVTATNSTVGVCINDGGKFNMTGGTINVTGDLTGGNQGSYDSRKNCAAAIGETPDTDGSASIVVTGGTINLTPTAGRAYAFCTYGDGWSRVTLGGNLVINVNAEEGAQAAALAIADGSPCALYENVQINGYTAKTNKAEPSARNFFQWLDSDFGGESAVFDRRPQPMN